MLLPFSHLARTRCLNPLPSSIKTSSSRRILCFFHCSQSFTHTSQQDDDDDDDEDNDDGGFGNGACSSHVPVLLKEVLAAFHGCNLHSFLDCTLGAGGHSSAMIVEHPEMQFFLGLDVDPRAHLEASTKLQAAVEQRSLLSASDVELKCHLFQTNFRNIKSILEQVDKNLAKQGVDGILLDLGMSSMQLEASERGFSLQKDGPADMRMDPTLSLKAEDILNSWPEEEVGRILRDYGEEIHWRRLARMIMETRFAGGIHSTFQLLDVVRKTIPARISGRKGWKKTAIRAFQALRIAVNDELASLKAALADGFSCLAPKGRLAVISFHSLEDRIVKHFLLEAMGETVKNHKFNKYLVSDQARYMHRKECESRMGRKNTIEGKCATILTKRPVIAGPDEVDSNPRSRSAKLRIVEKK